MLNTTLLHQLITASAERAPDALALTAGKTSLSYRALDEQVASIASGLVADGGQLRDERYKHLSLFAFSLQSFHLDIEVATRAGKRRADGRTCRLEPYERFFLLLPSL